MKLSKIGLTMAIVLAFASAAIAEMDSKTSQKMDEVIQKARKVDTYRVDVKMVTEMLGQTMVTDGEMAFKKPDKIHMTTVSPVMGGMKHEIFSTGDLVWTYMPMMKMVTKIDMAKVKEKLPEYPGTPHTSDLRTPFEGVPKDSVRFVEEKNVDGTNVYVFEAFPKQFGQMPQGQPGTPQMVPHKMMVLINTETGLPHKLSMFTEDGVLMMEQQYSNFRINIPIDDSEFAFTPPEDAQVMDMTEATINMMQDMQKAPQQP